MRLNASELARRLDGSLEGGDVELTGFAPAEQARPGDVTFAENEKYAARAAASQASAVIVPPGIAIDGKTCIRVANVRVAFARTLEWFHPETTPPPGIHPTAIVAATAQLGKDVHIGPWCVVGERAQIGDRTILLAGVFVGDDCRLGEDCRLFPNVTLYPRTRLGRRVRIHAGAALGSDGYGYVLDNGRHRKVPQIGWVEVGDDVEIGANVTIDRGALGPTVVGEGTKIDNLVQLGHNVQVGKHCLLVSQVGIAGSTRVGDYTTLAGQVGLAGHLRIGSQVTIGAKSGVMNHIPDGQTWLGIPAAPVNDAKRAIISLRQLP
ncbi:MAG: UDP-3-O-(3-hydroxymyristoyl)glucosamine N-acyltransferase, partial [Verrucomicrobia bacterium]